MGYPPCVSCYSSGCCTNLPCCPEDKKYWPELAGTKGEYAKTVIEEENPSVTAIILPEGDPRLKDFCCNRVYVWVKRDTGIVNQVPMVG